MPEFLENFIKKVTDIFYEISKKFDNISDKIYEQTGKKINIGYIVIGILLVLFTFTMVKMILGWVSGFLFGG